MLTCLQQLNPGKDAQHLRPDSWVHIQELTWS